VSNLATIGWPSGTDTGWPSEPRNMLPGRVEAYPQGTQRAANPAEQLLSQAVGWWDAAAYRDGDRLLRNRGVAGDLLDMQLGSSDRVATTNDPLFLAPEDSGYVYLPGVNGNFLSVPDENALDITGDIDVRVRVAMDNWTPSAVQFLFSKHTSSPNQGWYLRLETNGTLRFLWSTNGSTNVSRVSTAATGVVNGATKWVRATFDVDNGASGHDVKFFTSDDGATWTQLGSTVTTAGTTSIFSNNANVLVGNTFGNSANLAIGKFYRAQILDGIDGTTVLDIDCDAITDGSATSFTAVTNQTVTINRSTSGRKSVAVPSKSLKKWDDPHVYLPGVNGNFLSVPDENALDITGDIDIRVRLAMDDWTPSATNVVYGSGLAVDQTHELQILGTGVLRFVYLDQTVTTRTDTSSVAPNVTDGSALWIRVTLDVDNGASGRDTKFYTSTDDGLTWVQLGSTVTTAGVISVPASTSARTVGARSNGAPCAGKFYRAVIYSDLTETNKVLDIDCAKAPTNFTAGQPITFLADTGQTVTLNSTAGSGMKVRGTRFSSGRSLFLLGTDDFFECVANWQHQLLNFGQGDSFTVLAVVRQWATPANNGRHVSKRNASTNVGYDLFNNGTNTNIRSFISDGTNSAQRTGLSSFTLGSPELLGLVVNGVANTFATFVNSSLSATTSTLSVGLLANGAALTIGRFAGSVNYADMEFTSAAVFRRALTPDEIKTITSYYGGI
jgi:hypothetical protein